MVREIWIEVRGERQLRKMSAPDQHEIFTKIEEYEKKPELLNANLKVEQAGLCKMFSRKYKMKVAHFRVGDKRVIGLIEKDIFHIVATVPKKDFNRELDRIGRSHPDELS